MEQSGHDPSFGQGLELSTLINKAIASAVKKTKADSEKIQKVIGKPGAIFKLVEGLFAEDAKTKPSILKLISGGENLMIEVSDGKATIAEAKKIFKSGIDSDFKNWGLNKSGTPTGQMNMDVHEMVGDGTFVQIFNTISTDLDIITMSQAQVIRFCEKYPTWLRQEGYGTFFLIKEDNEYFVVFVLVYSDGLNVRVYRLEGDSVWRGEDRRRVVSPQLIPLAV